MILGMDHKRSESDSSPRGQNRGNATMLKDAIIGAERVFEIV